MAFTADAVEHSVVSENNGELRFTTPKDFELAMNADDINKAVKHLGGRPMRVKITIGDTGVEPAAAAASKQKADETAERALANPEVQRFRELFGGEVRDVRNLKE
jgi:hypothetical protein